MSDSKIVMYDSDEAAVYKKTEGWFSSDGHFCGDSEHLARRYGSTHHNCESCGKVIPWNSWCSPCRALKDNEAFNKFPVEKWDGETPLCLYTTDTYFFGNDVLDYIADLPDGEEPKICKCTPNYLHIIEPDQWADDLPEDGELSDRVQAALDVLNATIEEEPPSCWYEDRIAIDVDDLRARVATYERGRDCN